MKIGRNLGLALICILLGIIMATQYKSVYNNNKVAFLNNKSMDELRQEIISKNTELSDLSKRNQDLLSEVSDYESKRSNNDTTLQNLKTEVDHARLLAGLVEVQGKGVVIKVDNDAPLAYVNENNLLDVLNELRASDAQAISINDQRVTALTEVREAGRYMMINKQQTLAPFVIKAIADPEKLEHTLQMIGGVKERLEENWFLKVEITKSDNIVIPAIIDDNSVLGTDLLTPVEK